MKICGWQQNIGLISQDNYLDDTLENNIIFLNDKNSIDKNKFDDAIFIQVFQIFKRFKI